MPTPLILLGDDVELPIARIQAAVRDAFLQLGAGLAVQPAQVVTDLPGGGDVIAYQAVMSEPGVYAVKVSPYLPRDEGRAVVTAWTLLVSTVTGEPILLVDATRLTAERTAATTAIAVDLLARPDARTLAVIGFGAVGQAHLRHVREVREFTDVRIYSRSSPPAGGTDLKDARLADSAEDAAAGADVILLCTSAAETVIDLARLSPRTLVTSVSTNAPMAREIDPEGLLVADVYADLAAAAFAAGGEMRLAAAQFGFACEDIRGDLAGLLSGAALQPSGSRPVFFRSVGLGIEDAAVAVAAMQAWEDHASRGESG